MKYSYLLYVSDVNLSFSRNIFVKNIKTSHIENQKGVFYEQTTKKLQEKQDFSKWDFKVRDVKMRNNIKYFMRFLTKIIE